MADVLLELMGILEKQTDLVSQIVNNSESSLQSRNVIAAPNSTFKDQGTSTLNSAEKKKLHQVANIFVTEFFDEQKKRQKDTAEKTKISKLTEKFSKKEKTQNLKGTLEKEQKGLFSEISDKLSGFFSPKGLFRSILKKVTGVGKPPKGSKIPKGARPPRSRPTRPTIPRRVPPRMARTLPPAVGGEVLSQVNETKSGWKAFTGKLSDAVKNFGKEMKPAWEGIKSELGIIGKSFTEQTLKAIEYIKNTPITTAFSDFTSAAGKWIDGLKSSIKSITESIGASLKGLIPGGAKGAITATAEAAPAATSAVATAAKTGGVRGFLKSGLDFGGSLLRSGGTFLKSSGVAALEGAKSLGSAGLEGAKELIKGRFLKVIENIGGTKGILKSLKGNAVIGAIIEGILGTIAVVNKKGELDAGNITLDQFHEFAGQTVAKSLVNTITTALGTTGGAVLGALLGPPGAWIGGFAGGYLGAKAGDYLGDLVNEYIFPEKYQKMVGEAVTGLFMSPRTEEMQDFIFSKGKAYPFSSKDEIIGVKEGGPADKLLSPITQLGTQKLVVNTPKLTLDNVVINSTMEKDNLLRPSRDSSIKDVAEKQGHINEHMKLISSTNSIMIEYLKTIAQNTAIMAKGAAQNMTTKTNPAGVPNPNVTNSFQKYSTTLTDNRSSYTRSAYALD